MRIFLHFQLRLALGPHRNSVSYASMSYRRISGHLLSDIITCALFYF
jgi:hypothetical protein